MTKFALLIVDMQNAFGEIPSLKESLGAALVTEICPIIELFRKTKNSIFFIQHVGKLTPEGTREFDLLAPLVRHENEFQIIKYHRNSFFKTDLADRLLESRIEFVVVCGYAAGYCVNATAQGAAEHGFKVALLRGGIVGDKETHVQVAFETHPVISRESLKHQLESYCSFD